MATPKRRISHARTHNRKAKFLGSLRAPEVSVCTHCGEVVQLHRLCGSCGYYRGKQILKTSDES
ncbi:MAG: 50S ribosomal protein L32 [Synergistaceae bacterium]|jgi:large subunit ribosomal protein L32|nr:50S ribosomal protein L32 [Synergistaceae bacterium]